MMTAESMLSKHPVSRITAASFFLPKILNIKHRIFEDLFWVRPRNGSCLILHIMPLKIETASARSDRLGLHCDESVVGLLNTSYDVRYNYIEI